MSELLHNMCAPPRSQVHFEKRQLSRYLAFNPLRLAALLKLPYPLKGTQVKEYLEAHPRLKKVQKPSGFMLAETVEVGTSSATALTKRLKTYRYDVCNNIGLLIAVFTSTVGDLYIPSRTPSFEDSHFQRVLLFPKQEVTS